MSQDVLLSVMNSMSLNGESVNIEMQRCESCDKCLNLDAEFSKSKHAYNDLLKNAAQIPSATTIVPGMFKLDLEPLAPRLLHNREAHVDYIRITKENADTLRDIVEQARTSNPLDNALAYACMYTRQIQELHDLYVVQYLSKVNDHARAKAVKSIKMKEWKPTVLPRKPVKSTVIMNIKPSSASQWRPKEVNPVIQIVPRKEKCTLQCALSSKEEKSSNLRAVLSTTSIRLRLHQMTHAYISSGLVQNPSSSTPNVPPSKKDLDNLFQPLFDEYFNPTPC
ncbi:hypothetical protein Tco_1100187 [Tanacetum coccineum]